MFFVGGEAEAATCVASVPSRTSPERGAPARWGGGSWEVAVFRPSITLAFGLLAALMACTSAPSATLVAADAAADDAVVEDVPLRPDVAPDVPELDTAAPADLVVFDQPNVLFDGSNDASVPIDVVEVDTRVALDALADTPCAAGQTRCASACVDLERDPANCGACGTRCDALPGVRGDQVRCEGGRCVLSGACTADRADCDRDPSNVTAV